MNFVLIPANLAQKVFEISFTDASLSCRRVSKMSFTRVSSMVATTILLMRSLMLMTV
jgi:hypothetical protein